MAELKFPDFFITLFTKIFGQKANLAISIFMFSQSLPGKKLTEDIKIAFTSPEGKRLLLEIKNALEEKSDD